MYMCYVNNIRIKRLCARVYGKQQKSIKTSQSLLLVCSAHSGARFCNNVCYCYFFLDVFYNITCERLGDK